MPLLAKIVSNVRQDAVARRDPVQQLTVTTQDVNAKLDFFEETLTMDVSRDYLRDLFYDLKHAIQMREITIDAVSSLNTEMTKIANNATDSLTVVTDELQIEKKKNRDLAAELRAADAKEAQAFDEALWVWARVVARSENVEVDQAYEEIIAYLAQLDAEADHEASTNEDDAA